LCNISLLSFNCVLLLNCRPYGAYSKFIFISRGCTLGYQRYAPIGALHASNYLSPN
jgi:hypothetical protein